MKKEYPYSHVMIGVPTRGTVVVQTASRLEAVRDNSPGLRPIFYQPGSVNVAFNRNLIVEHFLRRTGCEYLVMVDDDIVPPLSFLDLILPVPDGFGMVGVPYPIPDPRSGALVFCVYDMDDRLGFKATDIVTDDFAECDGLATGCVAIPRRVLEHYGSNCFRTDADPGEVFHGEDLLFCRDLRRDGWKVGYNMSLGYCDHIRVAALEPIVNWYGNMVMHLRGDTIQS